ncbi:hypothetical protein EQVG_00447 [Emiliania huxleyi virus 207]|nr:hypothetical protein EQVG_00447 [Emiliania huxleyi virus 207]AEP16288.1 hypothetical protein ERVG_00415 [Emiliania huxleyi virus 208]
MATVGQKRTRAEVGYPLSWLKDKHPIEEPDLEYSLKWFKKHEYDLETSKLQEVSEKVGDAYDTLWETTQEVVKAVGYSVISDIQGEHVFDRIDWRYACDKCVDFGELIDEIYYELTIAMINTKLENADIDPDMVDEMASDLARDIQSSEMSEIDYNRRIQEMIDA